MSDSPLVPVSAELAVAGQPAWLVPASPEPSYTTVGIDADGQLYVYGDTPASPGPIVPAILGQVTGLTIEQHGEGSRYGLRPYLAIYLATPVPGEIVNLRLPCKESVGPAGEPSTPWSVRSLVGALLELDLHDTAVKLQTKRGREATFFRVIPHDSYGTELPDIRAQGIGPRFGDLELAVDHLRKGLNLPPLTPDIAAHDV